MSKINKYAEGKIINSISRADEINVSTETKDAVESVSVANLAAGNTSEALIGFDILRKFQTQNNIDTALKMMAEGQLATNKLLAKLSDEKGK